MPSRRTLLLAAGTLAGGGIAGYAFFNRGVDGYVQLKSVQGRYERDGNRFEESIVRVTLSSPPGEAPPEVTFLHDEWRSRFETPREPVVSDSLHDDLRRRYDTLRYVVGVCSPDWADSEEPVGCYNVSTARENFNRVQVHDRVRASSDGTSLSIYSVDGDWTFASE